MPANRPDAGHCALPACLSVQVALTSSAMAKQKPKAKGSRKRSDGQSAAQESKPNLFERLYNRKKFDILGKKAKGERKHGQSVHDAVDKVMPHAVAAVEPAEPFREKKSF
jgi:hypothetical protein